MINGCRPQDHGKVTNGGRRLAEGVPRCLSRHRTASSTHPGQVCRPLDLAVALGRPSETASREHHNSGPISFYRPLVACSVKDEQFTAVIRVTLM